MEAVLRAVCWSIPMIFLLSFLDMDSSKTLVFTSPVADTPNFETKLHVHVCLLLWRQFIQVAWLPGWVIQFSSPLHPAFWLRTRAAGRGKNLKCLLTSLTTHWSAAGFLKATEFFCCCSSNTPSGDVSRLEGRYKMWQATVPLFHPNPSCLKSATEIPWNVPFC